VYGFVVGGSDGRTVEAVETSAETDGLLPDDRILKVGENEIAGHGELQHALAEWAAGWSPQETPRPLNLTVQRGVQQVTLSIPAPRSLPLLPTQLYSSLDGLLLFFLLAAYYPFRRRPGEVMALLMMCYAVNRFLIEQLRSDNLPTTSGLTLSQNISIALFAGGALLMLWLRTRPDARGLPTRAQAATGSRIR
jgi:hypothetical protein